MKDVGITPEGNHIVEMSKSEYSSIRWLESSFAESNKDFFEDRSLHGVDLSPVFKAFEALAQARTSIYQVQEYINFLASVFGGFEKDKGV